MKRVFLLVMIAIIASSSLSALDASLGAKFGIGNYGDRGPEWKYVAQPNYWTNNFTLSYTGGLFLNLGFTDSVSVQIEGLYGYRTLQYEDYATDYWYRTTFNSISIPVLFRLDFNTGKVGIYVQAGPQFVFLLDKYYYLNSTGTGERYRISGNPDLTVFLFGVSAGTGVSLPAGIGFFDIGLTYSTNLTQFDSDYKGYAQGLELQLAYGFNLSK